MFEWLQKYKFRVIEKRIQTSTGNIWPCWWNIPTRVARKFDFRKESWGKPDPRIRTRNRKIRNSLEGDDNKYNRLKEAKRSRSLDFLGHRRGSQTKVIRRYSAIPISPEREIRRERCLPTWTRRRRSSRTTLPSRRTCSSRGSASLGWDRLRIGNGSALLYARYSHLQESRRSWKSTHTSHMVSRSFQPSERLSVTSSSSLALVTDPRLAAATVTILLNIPRARSTVPDHHHHIAFVRQGCAARPLGAHFRRLVEDGTRGRERKDIEDGPSDVRGTSETSRTFEDPDRGKDRDVWRTPRRLG